MNRLIPTGLRNCQLTCIRKWFEIHGLVVPGGIREHFAQRVQLSVVKDLSLKFRWEIPIYPLPYDATSNTRCHAFSRTLQD